MRARMHTYAYDGLSVHAILFYSGFFPSTAAPVLVRTHTPLLMSTCTSRHTLVYIPS